MAIHLEDNSIVELSPVSHHDLPGPAIPGSIALSAASESYRLLVKELRDELYTLRYNTFCFFRNTSFHGRADGEGIFSRAALQNHFSQQIGGVGRMTVKERQFFLLAGHAPEWECYYKGGEEYVSFDLYCSPELYTSLYPAFPELADHSVTEQPRFLGKNGAFITPFMQDVIRGITDCPYDAGTAKLYMEIKIKEYLYVMLERVYRQVLPSRKLNPTDIERITEARRLLLQDLSRKPYSIRDLARAVGINEFKLKAGFRELFGTGVFECIQDERMEAARTLLITTDKPIKEICTMAGYPRLTNFITAFRRKFGYTPGSLRRL